MADFKLKKGYDIRLAGKTENEVTDSLESTLFAMQPPDFLGIKPRLQVAEGDQVKIGSMLFNDKINPDIQVVSPASGTVKSVNRGDRRAVLEVIVDSDGKDSYVDFQKYSPVEISKSSREEIVKQLLQGGMWPLLRQRPFAKIADPADTPRDIFINAMNTAPLAPDYKTVIQGDEKYLAAGIEIIKKLTEGKVFFTAHIKDKSNDLFAEFNGVEKNYFSGPHPAGNIGVHIHHIKPVKRGDIVWYLNLPDMVLIGKFFMEGKFPVERIVAIAGSSVIPEYRKYFRTRLGASVASLVQETSVVDTYPRFISGNVLNGRHIKPGGFMGFYDYLLTVIPEGKTREFMGWISPGFSKNSYSKTFLSSLLPAKEYVKDTMKYGGPRAFVQTGEYENVVPMDILPAHLVKSIMAEDVEEMEALGLLELAEEDVALCSYICPSKIDFGEYIRKGLDILESEG